MKYIILIGFLLLAPFTFACDNPVDYINESMTFCSDTFDFPEGITVTGKDFKIDCNTAVIRGDKGRSDFGFYVVNATNISIENCNVLTFKNGMILSNVLHSRIINNNLIKNDIGVRVFDSYENIVSFIDRSINAPLSVISSSLNAFHITNKNVNENFCVKNSCNSDVITNYCIDNDFYCSDNCLNDSDCITNSSDKSATEVIDAEIPKRAEVASNDNELGVQPTPLINYASEIIDSVPEKKPFPLFGKIIIYLISYIATYLFIHK